MPIIYKYRVWCKTCNDFTLHHEPELLKHNKKCITCKTDYTPMLISEIPKEKVIEQRKRYTEQKARRIRSLYTDFIMGYGAKTLFSENPQIEIIESDCGQKAIDEAEANERELKYQQKQALKLEIKQKFKGLGRNDKCACGSNIKYKNCCLDKNEKILLS